MRRARAKGHAGERQPVNIVLSPDNRYAFLTAEGVGEEPGMVGIVDLEAWRMVTELDVPPQAAGIDFWKME